MKILQEKIIQFPITPHLDEIYSELQNSKTRSLVLMAETGAGKSTILPLFLACKATGKILMTEPRRLAALGVAHRIADLGDEDVGEEVGYKVHLESRVSENTKLEVVTNGVLLRMLQEDPVLEKYNIIILDEFHERSIEQDLGIAFLKEAMELRDDLFLIVMSATIDAKKIQDFLGDGTPVLDIPGRCFPVAIKYENFTGTIGFQNERTSIASVSADVCLKMAGNTTDGNILVFLPGLREIKASYEEVQRQLEEDFEVMMLHSSVSLAEQKKVIEPSEKGKRRIIISSSIAETSLTVPGVTVVIDSGLSRINRMNINTGMGNLETVTESEFSAIQRAGRAGREREGICIRLWDEYNPRVKNPEFEIKRGDITGLVLDCAERGITGIDKIEWLEKPSEAAWQEASKLLFNLGFLDCDNRITEKGKIASKLGVHPRLAGIAIAGAVSENSEILKKSNEILVKFGQFSKNSSEIQQKFIKNIQEKLKFENSKIELLRQNQIFEISKDNLILSGFPDRLAKKIRIDEKGQTEFQFPSGRVAFLKEQYFGNWICAPEVSAGDKTGIIFEYMPVDDKTALEWLKDKTEKKIICRFDNGKIEKCENELFGEIQIAVKKLETQSSDLILAWVNEVKTKGIECLPFDEKCEKFYLRAQFYMQQAGIKKDLQKDVEDWLPPFMGNVKALTSQVLYDALFWYLEGDVVNREAPEMIVLENGNKAKIKYEKMAKFDQNSGNSNQIRPIIEIIIQRIFGCYTTPKICGMKCLLKLLSPASRPLQITEDLENFWTGAWVEICKEMKGRYPKHNWQYTIAERDK